MQYFYYVIVLLSFIILFLYLTYVISNISKFIFIENFNESKIQKKFQARKLKIRGAP